MHLRLHALLGLALLLLAAPVSAQSLGSAAEREDAAAYAADHGVTLEEALRRLDLQETIGDLDAQLTKEEISHFGGLSIEHQPEFQVTLRSTDPKFHGRLDELEQRTGLVGLLRIEIVDRSLQDLRDEQASAVAASRQLRVPADLDIDIRNNRVELYVTDRTEFNAALSAAESSLSSRVVVREVETLAVDEADIYGGLPLSSCTTGYGIQHRQSFLLGIVTSGHCNSQSYSGTNLPLQQSLYTGPYDVQWHRPASYSVKNLIKTGSSSTRSITGTRSRSSQSVGNFVAKHGKTTGYTYGYITSKDYLPSWMSGATATYIRVSRSGADLSSGGDSGGPWYSGNTAYGVHKCGLGNDSCYMAVNYVDGLDVRLLTASYGAPTGYSASYDGEDICYNWNAVPGAVGYNLYTRQSNGTWILYRTPTSPRYCRELKPKYIDWTIRVSARASNGGEGIVGGSFNYCTLYPSSSYCYDCEAECSYELSECQVDFCYWDYDQYMCQTGCDLEYQSCINNC